MSEEITLRLIFKHLQDWEYGKARAVIGYRLLQLKNLKRELNE